MNKSILISALERNHIEADGSQTDLLCRLVGLLVQFNSHTNLTAITDDEGIAVKHIADCLALLKHINNNEEKTLLDVGAGGGFPTLPLAIMRPKLKITALDSTAKKLEFIKWASDELSLDNVDILCGRAEELAKPDMPLRESFDIVSARAVAEMRILSELCVPFIKIGGSLAVLKGEGGEEEFASSADKLTKLGMSDCSFENYRLYGENEDYGRCIILGKKKRSTDAKFPRSYNKIKAKP